MRFRFSKSLLVSLVAVLALVAGGCVVPSTSASYSYTVESNIVYGQGAIDGGADTTDLLLDLYIPDTNPGDGPRALMVMVHGGSFLFGSKTNSTLVREATRYAERGYLVAAINYRLGGSDPLPSERVAPMWNYVGGSAAPPLVKGLVASLDDTLTAIDFLHQRPDVFAPWTVMWGYSAGAVTALNVGYILDDFGIDGPPVLGVIERAGGFYLTPDGSPFESANEPPLYVMHGTNDTTVPFSLTTNIENWADSAGNTVEVQAVLGAGHSINTLTTEASPGVSLYQRSVNFADQNLF